MCHHVNYPATKYEVNKRHAVKVTLQSFFNFILRCVSVRLSFYINTFPRCWLILINLFKVWEVLSTIWTHTHEENILGTCVCTFSCDTSRIPRSSGLHCYVPQTISRLIMLWWTTLQFVAEQMSPVKTISVYDMLTHLWPNPSPRHETSGTKQIRKGWEKSALKLLIDL